MKKIKIVSILIVVILLFSFTISFSKAEVQNISNSIESDDKIYADKKQTFTSIFRDLENDFDISNGIITFDKVNKALNTTIRTEYNISDVKNNDIFYYNEFNIIDGNITNFNNTSELDSFYSDISSTPLLSEIPNQPFNLIDGISDFNGNLEFMDSDYSEFKTESFTEVLEQPFDIFNGTSEFNGFINEMDSNYTIFNPEIINTENEPEYITSVEYTEGAYASGNIEFTWIDNTQYYRAYDEFTPYIIDMELIFDNELNGRDFYISADWWSQTGDSITELRINDIEWKTGNTMDFENDLAENVNKISFYITCPTIPYLRIYYFKIVDIETEFTAFLNFTVDIDGNKFVDISDSYIHYSYRTNDSQLTNFSIYNYDFSKFDTISSNVNLIFQYLRFELNSSYFSIINEITLRFMLFNDSESFQLHIDMLKLHNNNKLKFNIDIDGNIFKYYSDLKLSYAYITNVSQLTNFSIYNYETSEFVIINSDVKLSFETFNYNLESCYFNETKNLRLRFELFNISNDFQLNIDMLKIYSKCYLEFTSQYTLIENNFYSLIFSSHQFTNISQNIYIYLYNYDTLEWNQISVSNFNGILDIVSWNNETDFSEYLDINNNIQVKFKGVNNVPFKLTIDLCQFKTYYPLTLTYIKEFNELGLYRYRFTFNKDLENEYVQEWIYFTIIASLGLSLGTLIPFYVYIIVGVVFTFIMILIKRKQYITDKTKLLKLTITTIMIDFFLFLCVVQSIQIFLKIGQNTESNWLFTLLNALIFGVYLNICGLGMGKMFKRDIVKFTVLFLLVVLGISGFGYFNFLFKFNFPFNFLLFYNKFGLSSIHGIRFFSSNFILFTLILFISFTVESEVDY